MEENDVLIALIAVVLDLVALDGSEIDCLQARGTALCASRGRPRIERCRDHCAGLLEGDLSTCVCLQTVAHARILPEERLGPRG
jgi:hypothetical protein